MSYDPNMNEQTELPGEMYDEIVELLYTDFGDMLLGDSDIEKF